VTDPRPDALRPVRALQVAQERDWTLTVLDIDAAYKRHLAEGELWLPFCASCSRFLPAWISRCADHWDAGMEMAQVVGEFRLWSWVEYLRSYPLPVAVEAPYIVAAVDIEKGPRVHGFVLGPAAEIEGRGRGVPMLLDRERTKSLGTPVFKFASE
jgi:uncharacterized OB-fold protein